MFRYLVFGLTVSFVLLQALTVAANPAAVAQANAEASERVELQAIVDRMVLDFAARRAADERRADADKKLLFAQLEVKDQGLRRALEAKDLSVQKLKELEGELAQVTSERQSLVDEIADRDRQFEREITEYRRNVASIANSPDPRKRAALERYAAGDRLGGYDALRDIQKAETKAVAAGWREIATLGLDLKDRGEITSDRVILDFEEVQRIDGEDVWGWISLGRLYYLIGRYSEGRSATEKALEVAKEDRDRAAAANDLGAILLASGDVEAAKPLFTRSLEIAKKQAKLRPTDLKVQRDLSVSHYYLGDLLLRAGDFLGARIHFERDLAITEALAKQNPESFQAQRDLSVSLQRTGALMLRLGNLSAAREAFERGLEICEDLVRLNPASAGRKRDLLVAYTWLFEVRQDKEYLFAALRIAEGLDAEGRLPLSDRAGFEELQLLAREY